MYSVLCYCFKGTNYGQVQFEGEISFPNGQKYCYEWAEKMFTQMCFAVKRFPGCVQIVNSANSGQKYHEQAKDLLGAN